MRRYIYNKCSPFYHFIFAFLISIFLIESYWIGLITHTNIQITTKITLVFAMLRLENKLRGNSSILIIGRYNFDEYFLLHRGDFSQLSGGKLRCNEYPKADITYMTAHSSKGLGYDYVILINAIEGKYGFPSQIENDPIMKLVTVQDGSMKFAEERRLFYVALTRTKTVFTY